MESVSKLAYRSSHNVVYSSKYHLVWCPKYRRKALVGAVDARLVEIVRQLPTLWTNSWLYSTVGGALLSAVKRYVETQKVA